MDVEEFITRWSANEGGAERANYGLFLSQLCRVLDVPEPDPAGPHTEANDYVFERAVRRPDGSQGRIDLYKRGAFVLEAKQSRQLVDNAKFMAAVQPSLLPDQPERLGRRSARRGWDILMLNARQQAEDYARHLEQAQGWPPFVIVCDVGHCLELFADFRGMGKYEQFPDRQGYRIYLEDLRKPEVREQLALIWKDPQSLDPTKRAARATRDMAKRLAAVSRRLEGRGLPAEEVAHFLMRCLFTMFAEDVELLPKRSFAGLLEDCVANADAFVPLIGDLWKQMDQGGFAPSIKAAVRRFNGSLFKDAKVLPLQREEIGELLEAAKQDWREVEPAIFGTLLEQALDPQDRSKLGAHFTPRAYVERLVLATVIDPLRDDWQAVLATAEDARADGDLKAALGHVRAFHDKLCATRVLDPACGTGNFLYVTLDLMKRLEGEVLDVAADLGGQEALTGLDRHTVDPHQFLGLELNPRAAAIAELVLWIGYLQLHFRTKGGPPGEPILRAFGNINFGQPGGFDAVLTWDGYPVPAVKEEDGQRVETLPNARRPEWPQAEFIVGNPPFIGGKDIRARLGDLYAETLWKVHKHINASADFVMFWWDRAAETVARKGSPTRRFGFVTTNSITQEFSRRVIKKRLEGKPPVSLVMAIPDHPWTKVTPDSAAVRIAMTVAERGRREGLNLEVVTERGLHTDTPEIVLAERRGPINADLSTGADVTAVHALKANDFICSPGVKLHGSGFILTPSQAEHLGLGRHAGLERHIRPYRNGRDLTSRPRRAMVIDLFGLSAEAVRAAYPEVYDYLLSAVKPERDRNNRAVYRDNWWIFGEPRAELRPAISDLRRFIVTVETAKHRPFMFLDGDMLPDNMLVAVASADAAILAAMSSRIHVTWALARGGTLEDRPRYQKSLCFDPFPFPVLTPALRERMREAGDALDAFRKARLEEHPELTLTQLYNVLEALRAGRELSPEEAHICELGMVRTLKDHHDRIDALTFGAYGWPVDLTDEQIVERVVALNAERAAEEQSGLVRWLRPEYQMARAGVIAPKTRQGELAMVTAEDNELPAFPSNAVEQSAAVAAVLARAGRPLDPAEVASRFRRSRGLERKVGGILQAFARTGFAHTTDGGRTYRTLRAA